MKSKLMIYPAFERSCSALLRENYEDIACLSDDKHVLMLTYVGENVVEFEGEEYNELNYPVRLRTLIESARDLRENGVIVKSMRYPILMLGYKDEEGNVTYGDTEDVPVDVLMSRESVKNYLHSKWVWREGGKC